MNTFATMPLLPAIKSAIDALGFTEPTEIQQRAIPLLLENPTIDVHAQAQTGTGKTLAFGIPLLHVIDPKLKQVQGLIIAPTRELVLQIHDSLKDVAATTDIIIEPIYGGMPIDRQVRNIKRGAQIIVSTPGRLNDHLRRRTLSLKDVKVLVLDEADIMLDMGFKEEINEVLEFCPKNRAIWLFSATVMSGIQDLINSHMKNVHTIRATKKSVVSSQVRQYFCVVPTRDRVAAAARFIEADPTFYGIIFCQTKILTAEVMEELVSRGFKANCLHGDMKQELRNKVIKGFRNKDFTILVATDVAARGIDVSNLTHVINFSIPEEHENYIHRIGRTGRAGKEGVAIVFIPPSSKNRLRRLEHSASTILQEISIPPLSAIVAAKMGAVSDFIERSKKPKQKSEVYESLDELVSSFTQQEMHNALLFALEERFFKDLAHEKDFSKIKQQSDNDCPQEMCMDIGSDDGLTEQGVRKYLARTCPSLSSDELKKVRVISGRTFVSVSENRLHECLEALRATPIIPKKHRVFLVEDRRREDGNGGDDRRGGSSRPRGNGGRQFRGMGTGNGGAQRRRRSHSDR